MRSHKRILSIRMWPVYILERLVWQQCGGRVGGIVKMRRHHSNSPEKQRINDGGLEHKWWEMTETEQRTLSEIELGTFLTADIQL